MLDIKKTYDIYEKTIKQNKQLLTGIQIMLTSEGISQYTILQLINSRGKKGISCESLGKVSGIDDDIINIILEEFTKYEFIELKKDTYYITEKGRNLIIATYFFTLENL